MCKRKVVYISHPMSEDIIEVDTYRVTGIIKRIMEVYPFVIAIAPYAKNPDIKNIHLRKSQFIGLLDRYHLRGGLIKELWLYGNRITAEMQFEIDLCEELGVPVIPQTAQTHRAYFGPLGIKRFIKRVINIKL